MQIQLNEQQRIAVNQAVRGRTAAIKGSAGSGKTLVAMSIANSLCYGQRSLGESADKRAAIVTYTNSLVSYIDARLDKASGIEVSTAHAYLREFLKNNGIEIKHKKIESFIEEFVQDGSKFSEEFLASECKYILGRGLKDREKYLQAKRSGRKQGLREVDRNYVFDLLEGYLDYLSGLSYSSNCRVVDYSDLGNLVLEVCSKSTVKKNHIDLVIDEVQDLPITMIKALTESVDGKVIYIRDVAQSIYGSGFTWKETVGRTLVPIELKTNYRNTRQIYEAADSILKFDYEVDESFASESSQQGAQALENGPRPQLFFCSNEQDKNVYLKLIQLVTSANSSESICVAYRGKYSKDFISWLKRELETAGIACCNVRKPSNARVAFSTFHSMKGLEFDHVLLVDLDNEAFFANGKEDEEIERRLLFVAMTRAKKTLSMFSGSNNPLKFLGEISSSKVLPVVWNQGSYEKTYLTQIDRADESRSLLREQLARQNAQISELEERVASLKESNEDSKESLNSLLSEKDEEIIRLDAKFKKAIERQEELESKLKYFSSERQKALSHFDKSERELNREKYAFCDRAKILILGGDGGVKDKDIRGVLKDEGISSDAFERIPYDEVTNFDITRYANSPSYSDIFVGCIPHKSRGIGGASSLLQFLETHGDEYPKLSVFRNSDGTLGRITKNQLHEHVRNSDLYAFVKGL